MMKKTLILQLEGVTQSWGTHTFEEFRPTNSYPTFSGIHGLLGACLGIERKNTDHKLALANSIEMAVFAPIGTANQTTRILDFHTVLNTTKVDGSTNKNAILTKREYLCDARFLIAIQEKSTGGYSLMDIAAAVKKPHYTPFLGRRSCLLSKPLFHSLTESATLETALIGVGVEEGVIYSNVDMDNCSSSEMIRDIPLFNSSSRQFKTRKVFIKSFTKENDSVSE